jgi:hypothetical protein
MLKWLPKGICRSYEVFRNLYCIDLFRVISIGNGGNFPDIYEFNLDDVAFVAGLLEVGVDRINNFCTHFAYVAGSGSFECVESK